MGDGVGGPVRALSAGVLAVALLLAGGYRGAAAPDPWGGAAGAGGQPGPAGAEVLHLQAANAAGGAGVRLPADVVGTAYAGPVSRLQALGVLTVGDDGLFRPGGTLSRAEAGVILVRLRGFTEEEVAAAGSVPGRYADVPLEHWAAGYVNLMDSLGVVRGYADGTFRPEGPVTRAEFLTMLVRLLGYGDRLRGPWPATVLGEAERLGLVRAGEAPDGPATRGEVAVLVDRAAYRIPVAPALDPARRVPVQVWLGRGGGGRY
ncbi:MAG: S-layer homology domain-containing protein [Firmicutes bacterium]|nr:S-layer homology domain-containing protein [Bacillota bacterium]